MRAVAASVAVTPDGSDLRLHARPTASRSASAPATDLVAKLVRLQTRLDELGGGAGQLRRRVDRRGHDGMMHPFRLATCEDGARSAASDVRGCAATVGATSDDTATTHMNARAHIIESTTGRSR